MPKTYVLDTNVLIHDPTSLFKFQEHNLVLPIFVLEEIDNFKREMTERGRAARHVSRVLDDLRENGSLSTGAPVGDAGGKLRVYVPGPDFSRGRNTDQDILQAVLNIRKDTTDEVIFVTQDINLRVRGDALGLLVEGYENQSIDVEALFTGVVPLTISDDQLNEFVSTGRLAFEDERLVHENACVVLSGPDGELLGRGRYRDGHVRRLSVERGGVMGIKARNIEQEFAMDLLLDPTVSLVTIVGKAGSGKTLLGLASGLKQILDGGIYNKLLVSRPVVPMGKDLGYLPGTIDEKMAPWMQPIFDNLDFLLMQAGSKARKGRNVESLVDDGTLQVEPLTYIRGRSIPKQLVLIDEAQNLTPHEVKTIITRCGEGTKIVLTGDPYQIDNPYVDSSSNGLTITANKLRGNPLVGHIQLKQGERSPLATMAADVL